MNERFLLVVVAVGASAGAWLAYLGWKDRQRPEPRWLVALGLTAGMFAVGAALLGYRALNASGLEPEWETLSHGSPGAAFSAALLVGLVEELAKALPVVVIAWVSRHFDEPLDGIVYAGAAGIGFSAAETVIHLAQGQAGVELAARIIVSPITHALFATPGGFGIALATLQRRWWAAPLGLGCSVVLHASYDALSARPGLAPLAAALVGATWIWLLWTAARLSRV